MANDGGAPIQTDASEQPIDFAAYEAIEAARERATAEALSLCTPSAIADQPDAIPAPRSIEAEQSVIGGLLKDNSAVARLDGLQGEHFYRFDHRLIFETILRLVGAGAPVDRVVLAAELERSGDLERVGGRAGLGLLELNTPSAANIAAYAAQVRDSADRRETQALANDLCMRAGAGEDLGELLPKIADRLARVSAGTHKRDALRVEHLPDHWTDTLPPARPLVLGPYIPRRAASCVLGGGTASKTTLLCEWIAAVTTGTPWHEYFAQEGHVVILTWEDETADYHAKLHSFLTYARPDLLGRADLIRERLHIIPMHGSVHRLVAPDEHGRPCPTMLPHRVVELIKREFPNTVLVLAETVSRANAADESNEALAAVVAAGEIIAHQLDCGFTAVHHVSKQAAVSGIVDAHAGRGGSALADNSRASTVVALVTADMPSSLWPPGFSGADFVDREIVLVENARTSYARKAPRLHLERVYPERGAPYLRTIQMHAPGDPGAPKRDPDAEKLLGWLIDDKRIATWHTRNAIVKRFDEFGLTERRAGSALDRAVESGAVEPMTGKQYGDHGREVTRYRFKAGATDK